MRVRTNNCRDWEIPESKKATCKICFYCDHTGRRDHNDHILPCDLDDDVHKGITIGSGKTFYWMMIWHGSGNVTVFSRDGGLNMTRRWLSGDQEITIHFK